jgi:hypothetical protein
MLGNVAYYAQLALEAALGVFGVRIYEEPRYAPLATLSDRVEVRRYAPRLAAETEAAGYDVEARSRAFRILFAYIAGANAWAERIAMTAPVATAPPAEKIAMTTPVETAPGAGGVRMRFFLPAHYTAATAPRPTDARVRLIPVPEETMAVLRFSGRGEDAELARRTAALRAVLAPTRWRPVADPVVLFYDPPFTLPFLRRIEVAVRVERSGEAGP